VKERERDCILEDDYPVETKLHTARSFLKNSDIY
jgi:hypothetical protein